MEKRKILLVDDEAIVRDSISEWLRDDNYDVECAADGMEALDKVTRTTYDTAVVDLKMPGIDGLEVMKRIKSNSPQTQVIIITAYGTAETAVEAMKNGASDYMEKPFNPEELIKTIQNSMGSEKEIKPELKNSVADDKSLSRITNEAHHNIIIKKGIALFTRPFILGILAGISIGCVVAIAAYSVNYLIANGKPRSVVTQGMPIPNALTNPLITDVNYYKELHPDLTELLDLHLRIDNLQQEYFDKIESVVRISDQEINHKIGQGVFLLKGNDFPINQQFFRELKERLRKVITKYNQKNSSVDIEEIAAFHALVPFYHKEAAKFKDKINEDAWLKGVCPVCGTMPLMGKLAKNNGKLLLHCPLCKTDWRFPRMTCSFCNNANYNTLRYFYTDENKAYRANVCEQCKKYIKIVDERILNKQPILQIENIVTDYLDQMAKKEGYQAFKNGGYIE